MIEPNRGEKGRGRKRKRGDKNRSGKGGKKRRKGEKEKTGEEEERREEKLDKIDTRKGRESQIPLRGGKTQKGLRRG